MFPRLASLLLAGLPLATHAANRLVCINDQTVTYATNEMIFLDQQAPGSATIVDLSTFPPKALTVEKVPGSVIGPPTSVACVPGKPLALVTNAMRGDKFSGVWKHSPDQTLTLLDLDKPGIVAQIKVGSQPTGVSLLPDGKTAYVANRAEGTISVIDVSDTGLKERTRVKVAEPTDSLAHVQVSPDGKLAVATLNEAHTILLLKISPDGSPKVIQRIDHGKKPYPARFLPDGSGFAVTDIGTDSVSFYRLSGDKAEFVSEIPVGRVPEGLDISPDGQWVSVNCMEGANLTDKSNPKYGLPAKAFLIHRDGDSYKLVKTLEVEGGPQFAFFSPDGQYLVVSNTRLKHLSFYKVADGAFTDTGYRLPVDGEPVAIAR